MLEEIIFKQTLIPLFFGEDWSFHPNEESDHEEFNNRHIICDSMEKVLHPAMKLVEHILYHTTDVGPYFTNTNNWGLTNA